MNNPEESGILYLEDLPNKEIFISLNPNFFNKLKIKILNIGKDQFSNIIDVRETHIRHWLGGGSLIRLDILLKILKYFNYANWKNEIEFIRGKLGLKINKPKIPFNFNSEAGFRIVAGILGDGGIPANRPNPYYSNTNEDLIKSFIEDMKSVFGDLKYSLRKEKEYRKYSEITILEFSSLIYKIFLKIGLKAGKKIYTNPKIPNFVFNGNSKLSFAFISQVIDDEGSVNVKGKHIAITSTVKNIHPNSNLLVGIKELLLKEKVTSEIYEDNGPPPYIKEDRIRKRLQINGYLQLRGLDNSLNLRSKSKTKKLKILLKSYSQIQYPKNRCKEIYLSAMRKIQEEKGFFTVPDLTVSVNRDLGHVRNMIHKYHSLDLIKCIENYKVGKLPEYAKYIINKNENNS